MLRLRAAGLVIALFILPASAWGACRDRDLKGNYDLTAESTGDYGVITTSCKIEVMRDGTVRSGADCTLKNHEGAEAEAKVDGGEISVSRSCRVTGQIVIGGNRSVITKARMTRSKKRVRGAGTNVLDGSRLTFTAIRQVATGDEPKRTRKRKRRWWNWLRN